MWEKQYLHYMFTLDVLGNLTQDQNFVWTFFLPKIVLSIICGIVIGLDRELKGKAAGLRTCIIVCLGAAMFSSLAYSFFKNNPGQGDPMRVIAQIVSGIGFLGAGVIFRGQNSVTGITTAAVLWLTAAVGSMIGIELYVSALLVSVACVCVVVFAGWIENFFLDQHKRNYACYSLLFSVKRSDEPEFSDFVRSLLKEVDLKPSNFKIVKHADKVDYEIRYCTERESHNSFPHKISVDARVINWEKTKQS